MFGGTVVGCGSSTSTALRAEYECEYGRGKLRSGGNWGSVGEGGYSYSYSYSG
jgi:hypothetical protein